MDPQGPNAALPEPPPAAGIRLAWRELPERLRAAIESWLGSGVVSAVSQPGGFSPGLAARLRTASGRRVFAKAVGPTPNAHAPAFHRREAAIAARLPATAPVSRLLWSLDEGDGGWVVLLFEDVEGRIPAHPWRADELARVMDALVALAGALTPSPLSAERVADWFRIRAQGWRQLRGQRRPDLDAWSARHLDALADLEARAFEGVSGETLLHFDLRADNLLLTPEGVVVVDWPHAQVGAAWVDLVLFAPSVAMQDGPHPEALLTRYPPASTAAPAAITAAVAAVAGFFTWQARQPPLPGLPTLRPFQAAQAAVAREWLARRTGWA